MVYAFGEIILVVLGILIALEINDWNQERTNLKLERVFLERMVSDIDADLVSFQAEVDTGNTGLHYIEKAAKLMQQHNTEEDACTFNDYYDASFMGALSPHYTTYHELESTGRINLVRDENLRKAIIDHYAFYKKMETAFDHDYTWRKSISHSMDGGTGILKYTAGVREIFSPNLRQETDWSFFNDPSHPSFQDTQVALAAGAWRIHSSLRFYSEILPRTGELKDKIKGYLKD